MVEEIEEGLRESEKRGIETDERKWRYGSRQIEEWLSPMTLEMEIQEIMMGDRGRMKIVGNKPVDSLRVEA